MDIIDIDPRFGFIKRSDNDWLNHIHRTVVHTQRQLNPGSVRTLSLGILHRGKKSLMQGMMPLIVEKNKEQPPDITAIWQAIEDGL